MAIMHAFITRHPVAAYYGMAFVISWGVLLLFIAGQDGIPHHGLDGIRYPGI
jgi:hypothetical protein